MILKIERVETVMSSSAIFQSSFERRQVQIVEFITMVKIFAERSNALR